MIVSSVSKPGGFKSCLYAKAFGFLTCLEILMQTFYLNIHIKYNRIKIKKTEHNTNLKIWQLPKILALIRLQACFVSFLPKFYLLSNQVHALPYIYALASKKLKSSIAKPGSIH